MLVRLALVISHPIQYYAPWFAELSRQSDIVLKVFYLSDFGVNSYLDQGFQKTIEWDLRLLDGYHSVVVPNRSPDPGTHRFIGLDNPGLVRQIRAWNPDAILIFGYAYKSHVRLLIDPRLWHVPFLFRGDSHFLKDQRGFRTYLKLFVRRMLFQRLSAALPVGKANYEWCQRSGVARQRLFLAPHAVDNARFKGEAQGAERTARIWRQKLGIPLCALVVLFAGKFIPKKRPLDLLAAFAAIKIPSAFLVLVGSGPLEAELRESVEELASDRVIFQDFQNQMMMPSTYALADLVVLPSYGAGETWGLCINEAMNMAKPVIVSSHVGCGPDLVIPGETGWIFPAGDVQALSAVLSEALSDPERLYTMGQAARAHIDRYSYAEATAGLRRALQAVLP